MVSQTHAYSNVFDGLSSLQFSDNIVWKMSLSCCYRCRLSAPPLLSNAIFALCRIHIFAYFIDNHLAGMYRFLLSSNLTMRLLDHSCISYYYEMCDYYAPVRSVNARVKTIYSVIYQYLLQS